jgi:hypothetical protein
MRSADQEVGRAHAERAAARQWLGLAFGVLVLAGLFAVAVVVGRMPPFDRYVTDPLFFKRCLVAHVNLALVAWFYSFVAGLLFLLPTRRSTGWVARHSAWIAGAGVLMLLFGAGMPESRPLLSNYIPTIDHWLFKLGQLLFAVGVLASFLDGRFLPAGRAERGFFEVPGSVRAGFRAMAASLVLAAITFGLTWLNQPSGLETEVYYDLLVWGGGHVLQLVCSVAMVSIWLLLLSSALGSAPVSHSAARALFVALVLPWTLAPLLTLQGTWSSAYRVGFTHLMQWGIFPVVSVFGVLCTTALVRARRNSALGPRGLGDPRIMAFGVSAGLTLLGFGLGAAIRGSNTMVPAHYHASVGGVTVAFMAATYVLLPAFGLSIPRVWLRRASGWQPVLYGAGMLLFAGGFALAGAYGMERKVYGAEQAARGMAETIGLGMMGVGGFVAIAGGLLFLCGVAAAWWHGARKREPVLVGTREDLREVALWSPKVQVTSTQFRN